VKLFDGLILLVISFPIDIPSIILFVVYAFFFKKIQKAEKIKITKTKIKNKILLLI